MSMTTTISSNSSLTEPMMYSTSSGGGKTPALIIAVGAIFSVLAIVATALRFYCRLFVHRVGLAVDDWLMLIALVLTIGMGVMLIIGAALHGLAQPTPQGSASGNYFWVTDDSEILTEQIFWAFVLTQDIAFGLVKLSILYFYRRIFRTNTFRILSLILIVLVSIWSIGFFFAYLFRCGTNFWALWAPLEYLIKYCYNSQPMFYTLTISDVTTDLLILSLPLFWVWRLNMTLSGRLALSGVFLLGAIVITAGVVRAVIFIQQSTNYVNNSDGIGLLTTLMFWSMIEMGIAVLAGNLPTIWPLMGRFHLESMLRTIRSAVSSRRASLKSNVWAEEASKDSSEAGPYTQGPRSWEG